MSPGFTHWRKRSSASACSVLVVLAVMMFDKLRIDDGTYLVHRAIRENYAFWLMPDRDAYIVDRQAAINDWARLTGERYEGYPWPTSPVVRNRS